MDISNIKFPERLFITGIDTDAGKSYATGYLAKKMLSDGYNVITQKFIQTGNKDFSEDIEVHRHIMGIPHATVDIIHLTAPVIFSYPASPDLASRIDCKPLDLSVIDIATDTLASQYSHILIEGAGGLMVPLIDQYLTIDYIKDRKLPVILVTNGKLGSVNHTLLSFQAIKDAGLSLFAVIYNSFFDKDEIICSDTKDYIQKWMSNHFPEAFFWEI